MNELTERLTVDQPIVMGGADPTVEELRNRTGEMGYALVKFTQTRGGTELSFPLDRDATDLSGSQSRAMDVRIFGVTENDWGDLTCLPGRTKQI